MKKIMQCKSAPEIGLIMDGGEEILLRFDVRCLNALQEMEGGLEELLKSGSIPEMAARILYAAAKYNNDNFDYETARAIISSMSIVDINGIIQEFSESMGMDDKVSGEYAKKMMAQFISGLK